VNGARSHRTVVTSVATTAVAIADTGGLRPKQSQQVAHLACDTLSTARAPAIAGNCRKRWWRWYCSWGQWTSSAHCRRFARAAITSRETLVHPCSHV